MVEVLMNGLILAVVGKIVPEVSDVLCKGENPLFCRIFFIFFFNENLEFTSIVSVVFLFSLTGFLQVQLHKKVLFLLYQFLTIITEKLLLFFNKLLQLWRICLRDNVKVVVKHLLFQGRFSQFVFDAFKLLITEGCQSKKKLGTGRSEKLYSLSVVYVPECGKFVNHITVRKYVSYEIRLVESCGGNRIDVCF